MEYTYIIFRRKIFCTGFYLGNSLLSCIICLICNYTWENISDTPLKKYIWYFIVLGVACMIIYGHMSLCMHACSYAYAHAYACMHYVYAHVHVNLFTGLCMFVFPLSIWVCAHACSCACMHIRVSAYMHHVCACVHGHVH